MEDVATPGARAHPPWRWATAGTVGALATLAVLLTLGLLAFAPMGALAASIGVPGAFAATIVGSIVASLVSRGSMPTAAPSSATALTLAALVTQLVRDPEIASAMATDPGQAIRWVGSGAACAVMGMGVVQLLLAALRMARLAHFVPQPVLAGFMNGVALLIILSQLPALMGAATGARFGLWLPALASTGPGPLLLALGTAACIALAARRRPHWPALLVGLLAGVLAVAVLGQVGPSLPLGAMVGAVNAALPPAGAWLPWVDTATGSFVLRHAAEVAITATLLGLIGSMESMLSIVAIEQREGRRIAADRELACYGLANLLGGLIGALPAVALRARAVAILDAGGRGPSASLAATAATLVIYVAAGPALAGLPQAVLAGVMLMVGVSLIDTWSTGLARRWLQRRGRTAAHSDNETRSGLLVMAVVCLLTVTLGIAAGVAVGVVLSVAVFVRRLGRTLVRLRLSGTARPSRRIYPGALEACLRRQRERIVLYELEGALFFGSGERLPDEVDAAGPPLRFIVLDLRRVTTVDESGAMLLHQIANRLKGRRQELLLAGVAEDGAIASDLRAFAPWSPAQAPRTFHDADHAVEAAEAALLAEAAAADPALALHLAQNVELPLAACTLMRGLSEGEVRRVAASLRRQTFERDEVIFRQGDQAEALYVVTAGSVSAVAAPGRLPRFASLGPGTMFGEMSLLDGGPRSADIVADGAAVVHVLSREGLQALLAEDPALAARLYRNIAAHLGERLRAASLAWQAASG